MEDTNGRLLLLKLLLPGVEILRVFVSAMSVQIC